MSKLIISVPSEQGRIVAQFNPTEYTLAKGVKIAETENKGLNGAVQHLIRGENEKLSFDLFFDSTLTGGDVAQDTKAVLDLAMVRQGRKEDLPVVLVTWGKTLSFTAFVESVQRKFTLFDEEGNPLRATVSLTFREYKTLAQLKDDAAQKAVQQGTRHYVVRRGDTLNRIAADQYDNDASVWPLIAAANPAVDLRQPTPGTVLTLPPKP